MQEIILTEGSKAVGKRIVELLIPATVNILAIKRSDVFIAPNGSTKLMANDILHVLAEDKHALDLLGNALDISL
jgi:cell volume regulation protein A